MKTAAWKVLEVHLAGKYHILRMDNNGIEESKHDKENVYSVLIASLYII